MHIKVVIMSIDKCFLVFIFICWLLIFPTHRLYLILCNCILTRCSCFSFSLINNMFTFIWMQVHSWLYCTFHSIIISIWNYYCLYSRIFILIFKIFSHLSIFFWSSFWFLVNFRSSLYKTLFLIFLVFLIWLVFLIFRFWTIWIMMMMMLMMSVFMLLF